MNKQMDLQEHLVIAERILDLIDESQETAEYVSMIIGTSKDISKKLYRIRGLLGEARSLLDDEYHKVIDSKQFAEYGHVYYEAYIKPKEKMHIYTPEEKKNV